MQNYEEVLILNNSIDTSVGGYVRVNQRTIVLDTKKQYVLVESNIECVIGEWNKDKGEYGVRVYFVSGNNIWLGGAVARSFLDWFAHETVAKFDERVKAGPPTVK